MKKKYLPTNSIAGRAFEENHCENCLYYTSNPDAKNQCRHLLKAFFGEENDRWWLDGKGMTGCDSFRDRQAYYRARRERLNRNQMMLFA